MGTNLLDLPTDRPFLLAIKGFGSDGWAVSDPSGGVWGVIDRREDHILVRTLVQYTCFAPSQDGMAGKGEKKGTVRGRVGGY